MLVTNYERSAHKSNVSDAKSIKRTAMAGLKDKVVLITGASSGIGRGTAVHFASLGSRISLVARNLDHLKAVAEECKAAGAKDVFFASHDLSTEAGCVATIEDTIGHFGGSYV